MMPAQPEPPTVISCGVEGCDVQTAIFPGERTLPTGWITESRLQLGGSVSARSDGWRYLCPRHAA
jgi:hypothetical protein